MNGFSQRHSLVWIVFVSSILVKDSPSQTNLINVTNNGTLSGNFGAATVVDHYIYYAGPGLQIFDVSNPMSPVLCYTDPQPSEATDVAVDGNHAYVAYFGGPAGGPVGIFDVSNRTNPISIGHIDGYWRTVAASGSLVLLGPDGGPTFQLGAYDVSNPANPVNLNSPLHYWPTRIRISGNYAYVIDGRVNVLDISNPANPTQVGTTFPFQAADAVISGGYAYLACWTNWFVICNISNPTNPVQVYESFDDTYGSVAVSGNYAFLIGLYRLAVYDVSNPTNAVRVASIPLPQGFVCCEQHGFAVTKGYAYAYYGYGQSIYSLGESPSPPLTLALTSTNLICSWSTPTTAFSVQENPDLIPTHWTALTNSSIVVGAQNQIILPKPNGTMFYRLVSQ